MNRQELFAEKTAEEKKRGRRIFLIVLSSSIAFSVLLGAALLYLMEVTSDLMIQIDHSSAPFKSQKDTVGEVLEEAGFHADGDDIVSPALTAKVSDDMLIRVQQVQVIEEQQKESTAFESVEEEDSTMKKGERKVTQEGREGQDLVTYKVTYTSGAETARKEVSRETLRKPQDEIIHVGIIETIDGFAYTRKETFEATAYTGGGRTASGTRARVGEIAVDPRVIPLGTTVYVEGFGVRVAEDTGGAIKGHIIDIYMSSGAECRRWGRRNVTVYLP